MPRLRTASVLPGCLGTALALLVACAAPAPLPEATAARWRLADAALRDPELERFLDRRLAAVGSGAVTAVSVVLRPPGLRAQWREPGVVLVWADLLLRVVDDAELAFVLAHEVGHARLGHAAVPAATATAADRLALEREADRWARARLVAMGYRADAGETLLAALSAELAGDPARATVRATIEARLAALRALPPPGDPIGTGAAPAGWPALQRSRREAWAALDPSLRDPARAAQVRGRWP
ncbi:MAG: M48 family metalloprotease [Pseudoxanthomonas mexicana]|nr:M48 family metalloprotease [Pseudoxanthomonas mexicana]